MSAIGLMRWIIHGTKKNRHVVSFMGRSDVQHAGRRSADWDFKNPSHRNRTDVAYTKGYFSMVHMAGCHHF